LIQRFTHLIGGLLPVILSVFTAPLTARSLGPENRGVLVQVLAIGLICAAVANFGLPWAARSVIERNTSAPSALKKQALLVGLRFLPFTLFGSFVLFSEMFDSIDEFGLAITYIAIMTFSAYTGVCANHLLLLRKTASLGIVSLGSSSIGFTFIVFSFLFSDLTLAKVLLVNCFMQMFNTLFLVFLSNRLETKRQVASSISETMEIQLASSRSKRYAWLTSSLDVLFSRLDVLFLSLVASTYFLGLYSIPGILVGVCYSIFSTVSGAGFSTSKIGNALTKLKVAVQINLVFVFLIYGCAGLLFPIVLVPIFGEAFAESVTLLPMAIGFSSFLAIAVPYLQYLLIKRSTVLPIVGMMVFSVGLAVTGLNWSNDPSLAAIVLAWTLFLSTLGLIVKAQPMLFSRTSRATYVAFLRAQ
jgi:O-antigen/teichoic acid export membrane protein